MPDPDVSVPWWREVAVYQVYPRSFADGDGDGVGDLRGLADRLDHVAGLGVGAIWLSPIFASPMADFGYDVSDYCAIDPVFGTLADLDHLVAEAHARRLKVVLDWVPNHTSDQHPWFVESRSSRTSPKRDWYVWRDARPDGSPPNNWIRALTNDLPAWTFDEPTGQWYLHTFLPQQPDLNWANPEVEAAMHDTLRFWLDRGVDGFRMDVVHLIGKDPALPDAPPERAQLSVVPFNDEPATHPLLARIRGVLDGYPGDRMSVGEVFLLRPEQVVAYYGTPEVPELHLSFNFPSVFLPWEAERWRAHIDRTAAAFDPAGAWPTWVLSNHDRPRHRTRFGGDEVTARAAAVLLLGLRGTPFLYMGEELGLDDAEIAPDQQVDPGGRDGCRAPIPWSAAFPHGWDGAEPWLPFPPDPAPRSAAAQQGDPRSMLSLYQRLLRARQASPALRTGSFRWLDAPEGVLAWERAHGDDRRAVVVAFGPDPVAVASVRGWVAEVTATGDGEGQVSDGTITAGAFLRPG